MASNPEVGRRTASQRAARLPDFGDVSGQDEAVYRYPTDRCVAQIRAAHRALESDRITADRVRIAGRLTRVRRQGRLTFAVMRDRTDDIQLFVDTAVLGAARHREFAACVCGDPIGVEGVVMTTRRGELSVRVHSFALLARALVRVDSTCEANRFPNPRSELCPPPGSRPRVTARPVLPPTPAAVLAATTRDPSARPAPPVLGVGPGSRGTRPRWPVRLLAGLTAVGGVLQLLTLAPAAHAPIVAAAIVLGPLWFGVAGRVVSVIVGLLLILLADQVAKRKRAAWQIALVLFAAGAVAHLLKGPQPLAVAFCVVMLAVLLLARKQFRAPVDPPSLLRLARFVPLYLGVVLAFGLVTLYTERRALTPELTMGGALFTVLGGLVGVDGPYTYVRPFFAAFFPAALLALGVTGLVVLVVLLFRPLAARGPHTADVWKRAEYLVHRYGWDSLAYFALREDKSFFFGSDGEAMLAYTYLGGYALVSGDPIGAPASVPRVLDEFLAVCDERAWNPALLAVREADRPLYEAHGLRTFYLGDEAIVRCDRFSLGGRSHKSLRAAVRRVARSYRFHLTTEANAGTALVDRLNAISARWRGKAPERGFTMSLSQDIKGDGANPEFLLCVAMDADGRPGGFLRLVPAYGPDFGYTLDLMRHDPDAPNGMTEFLIASTAEALNECGVVRLSMNFAMWGRLFADDVPFTPAQRLARRAVGALNPFFQVKSLHDFNAKFDPDWVPRVLAFRNRTDLPRVGLLYAGAEGFLALPGIGEVLVPKTVGGVGPPTAPAPPGQRTS